MEIIYVLASKLRLGIRLTIHYCQLKHLGATPSTLVFR